MLTFSATRQCDTGETQHKGYDNEMKNLTSKEASKQLQATCRHTTNVFRPSFPYITSLSSPSKIFVRTERKFTIYLVRRKVRLDLSFLLALLELLPGYSYRIPGKMVNRPNNYSMK